MGAIGASSCNRPPPSPPFAADADAVYATFERLCLSGGEAPEAFETTAWTDFPHAVENGGETLTELTFAPQGRGAARNLRFGGFG
jgi:hypothetical protein